MSKAATFRAESRVLHITNGDSAADVIEATGLPGIVLPWRDALHEGPVPSGLSLTGLSEVRARFVAQMGWRTENHATAEFAARDAVLVGSPTQDEVVLWFEHDLYDQLQLLQILAWFAGQPSPGRPPVSLVCGAEYIGASSPTRLRERLATRQVVTGEVFEVAQLAWQAFGSPDPGGIERRAALRDPELPYLSAAMRRHLQQFPSLRGGLSRSEAQVLEALKRGPATLRQLFVSSHLEREDPVFMGDTIFAGLVSALSLVPHPLVTDVHGAPLPPRISRDAESHLWDHEVRLTEAGSAVLAGDRDHVALNGIDRWLGGVHLAHGHVIWRWDESTHRLLMASP